MLRTLGSWMVVGQSKMELPEMSLPVEPVVTRMPTPASCKASAQDKQRTDIS